MKLKINKTFILYIFSAGSSFVLDLLLFTIFNVCLGNIIGTFSIILATIFARILSSLYNFAINSKVVFKKNSKKMFLQYYLLVVIQMCVSGFLVFIINTFIINVFATVIKFFVDVTLFIINYFIQKEVIFK